MIGVSSQKRVSVIEDGVSECSQTHCYYFVLELNQLLLVDTPYVLHKGEKYSFEYNVKDMIKCLVEWKNPLHSHNSTAGDLSFLVYPHMLNFKEIIKTHVSS